MLWVMLGCVSDVLWLSGPASQARDKNRVKHAAVRAANLYAVTAGTEQIDLSPASDESI